MAREHPFQNAHFRVDIGDPESSRPELGFSEVVFPQFPTRVGPEAAGAAAYGHLRLTRGASVAGDLRHWWRLTRDSKTPPTRTVRVTLLGPDSREPVLTWTFHDAYPVSLAFSPLDALQGTALKETLEIAFGRVEVD